MASKIDTTQQVLDILSQYTGTNPYIKMVKKKVYYDRQPLNDIQIDFILRNKDVEPVPINKITKIPAWYGENRKEAWKTEFVPEKIKIVTYLGETDMSYCCEVKYRQSVDPKMCFVPKKAVINNFFVSDYHNVNVDFQRYDNLSTAIDPNRKLREHQKEAVKFLLNRKRCILADDMGLGKTTSLSVAAIEGNFDSVLIICPASLKTTWRDELLWYVPEKDITIVEGFNEMKKGELEAFLGYSEGKSGKKKEELLTEAKNKGKWQFNRFVIINYDILDEFYDFSRARSDEGKQKALENSPILKYIYNRKSCLIIDEGHRLSNNTSTRYKVIKNLIKKGNPDSVYISTGTPITNNPLNFFYVLNLIENAITSDINYYKRQYCDAKEIFAKGEWQRCADNFLKFKRKEYKDLTPKEKDEMKEYINKYAKKILLADGYSNLDELKELVSHIYLRRTKEDIGDLPKKNVHELYYVLTPEQQLEYNRLWEEYEKAQLEENPDKVLNQDLLEGAIYRKYISNIMVPKTIALCDKILETEDKVIIATCYDEELYTLKNHYGDSAVIYNGKCTPKEKDKNKNEFINNPNIKVMVANIMSAGVGLTLIVSKSIVYNNISFVAGDDRQMEDRVYRIGQTRDVDIYYQIFKDTQYEHMWNIVLRKQLISDTVIKKESEK